MENMKIEIDFKTFCLIQDLKKTMNDAYIKKFPNDKALKLLNENEVIKYSLNVLKSIYEVKF